MPTPPWCGDVVALRVLRVVVVGQLGLGEESDFDLAGLHLGPASYGGAPDAASGICKGFDGNLISRANFAYQLEHQP